jgi:hypothetical protein
MPEIPGRRQNHRTSDEDNLTLHVGIFHKQEIKQ